MADCDVLICGLGPVGQLLALLLDDLGVSVIAFDKASEPYGLPRAAVVDDEVMRIFQAAGVDKVMRAAQVAPVVSLPIARGGRRRCSASATASSGTRRSSLSTSRRSSA